MCDTGFSLARMTERPELLRSDLDLDDLSVDCNCIFKIKNISMGDLDLDDLSVDCNCIFKKKNISMGKV